MYVVGLIDTCQRLAFTATQRDAEKFVGTLPDAEKGIYYIDGPCRGTIVLDPAR